MSTVIGVSQLIRKDKFVNLWFLSDADAADAHGDGDSKTTSLSSDFKHKHVYFVN